MAEVVPLGTPGTLSLVTVTAGIPTSGTGTVSTLDNIFDSTNGPVAIKAAATTAVDADKALVVQLHPRSLAPVGAATIANSTPVSIASDQAQAVLATNSLSGETLVANNAVTPAQAGLDGVQIVRTHTNLEDIVTANAGVGTATQTTCLPSSGAGIRTYVTSIVLCNTSAVSVTVAIVDGSTARIHLPLPAGSGCIFNPPVPLRGTAATAWSFTPSAAASTVTCSMIGFMSKV